MTNLAERLLEHARTRKLFPEPGLALLAVSGGPDSVALLSLMHQLAPNLGLTLAVTHVDHGIAPESGAVAEQVRLLAESLGVPFRLTTLSLGTDATETDARAARYAALRATQRALGARYLVTAHHAHDQVETILHRVLKGSGNAGLAGIPLVGPGGLVRPLLKFRRDELKEWIAGLGLDAHTDPANFDPRHERSWLRHQVLPLLRARLPDVDAHLLARGRLASEERRAWAAILRAMPDLAFRIQDDSAELDRAPLLGYEAPLAEALVRSLAREVGCRLGPRRSGRVVRFATRGQSGRVLELGDGWIAEIAFERLRIRRATPAPRSQEVAWGDGVPGEVRFGDWSIRWTRDAAGAPTRTGLVTWVTPGTGVLRRHADGDRLRPLGGVGRRAVSRLLMEARVPRRERSEWPLLVRGAEVLWIPGVCRSGAALPARGEPAIRLEATDGRA